MIKIVWFVPRPEKDIEGFEQWYQKTHAPIGMRQERLKRFRIARAWMPQPRFVQEANRTADPPVYRLPEGYWDSMEDIHACYRSVHALAAMGDGALNSTAMVPAGDLTSVLFVTETEFETAEHLCFDPASGAYRGGATTKLWSFLQLRDPIAFDREYRDLAAATAGVPLLKRHVLGECHREKVVLGRAMTWPPVGAAWFDRTLEYYFDRPEDVDAFSAMPFAAEARALVDRHAEREVWVSVRIQEVFFTSPGDQPLEEGWLQAYAGATPHQ